MPEARPSWPALRSFMQQRCGVQLGEEQAYLMDARLKEVASALKFKSVDEYVLAAVRPGAEDGVTSPLIDAMTTHETSFFRDGAFWRTLADEVIPRVHDGLSLRVWCAACSTGQEAWSLAMLLHERFPHLVDRTSIVATDVSTGVLATARAGTYKVFEANRGLSAPRLLRFFERDEANFRVKPGLRSMVTFTPNNLVTQDPPGGQFDLVLVRNVLIYFNDETRTQILQRVRSALRPRGAFAVGATELVPRRFGLPFAPGWYAGG